MDKTTKRRLPWWSLPRRLSWGQSCRCWLCRFVVEARKQDGEPYPPSTIQSLLSGLLRHMRERHVDTPDFLSKSSINWLVMSAMSFSLYIFELFSLILYIFDSSPSFCTFLTVLPHSVATLIFWTVLPHSVHFWTILYIFLTVLLLYLNCFMTIQCFVPL